MAVTSYWWRENPDTLYKWMHLGRDHRTSASNLTNFLTQLHQSEQDSNRQGLEVRAVVVRDRYLNHSTTDNICIFICLCNDTRIFMCLYDTCIFMCLFDEVCIFMCLCDDACIFMCLCAWISFHTHIDRVCPIKIFDHIDKKKIEEILPRCVHQCLHNESGRVNALPQILHL
jgi:hypothetical protein